MVKAFQFLESGCSLPISSLNRAYQSILALNASPLSVAGFSSPCFTLRSEEIASGLDLKSLALCQESVNRGFQTVVRDS